MALIKSALELALERTKDLTLDTASLEAGRIRNEGKRAAGKYLENSESTDLASIIGSFEPENREDLKRGMLDILAANLQLPTGDFALEKVNAIGRGYEILASFAAAADGQPARAVVAQLYGQVAGFLKKYLDDMKNVEQMIRKQWAPRLREKERQMAARMGQDYRMDPMQDPEFAAFYKQNVDSVRQQYVATLNKAKTDLAELCGFPPAGE